MMRKGWWRNRWIVVPVVIGAVVAVWNVYVATHNDGLVEGRVVDDAGRAVANASVTLYERGFVTFTAKSETRTDEHGRFRFTDFRNHALQLEAETEGLGRSGRRTVRLWFQGQTTRLAEALRLGGGRQ
jgi:hypothetical protein